MSDEFMQGLEASRLWAKFCEEHYISSSHYHDKDLGKAWLAGYLTGLGSIHANEQN